MNVKKIIKDRAEHYEMQDETLFLADALNQAVECIEIVDRLENSFHKILRIVIRLLAGTKMAVSLKRSPAHIGLWLQ